MTLAPFFASLGEGASTNEMNRRLRPRPKGERGINERRARKRGKYVEEVGTKVNGVHCNLV
ncbi:MAG: hypothetical protein ACTS42_01365 [Candidatus Hodgkinia cicadicola]